MAYNVCQNCALRLFNPKGHNINGVGSHIFGNMIIMPYVDNKAYKYHNLQFADMVQQITDCIRSSTGGMVQDYCYITPFIKCKQSVRCPINEDIEHNCMQLLKEEFIKYNPRNILLLGSNISHYFLQDTINVDSMFIDIRGRRWFTNYHPSIVNHDPDKAQLFEHGLSKWFNAVTNNIFDNYEVQ